MKPILWKTLTASFGYLAIAFACLIQWHGPNPWLRLDWFAAGYFGLRFVGSLHSLISSRGALRSRPLREEWWALTSDPSGPLWVMLLMALDLLVFLDYGHWRFTPWLERPALQAAGLALYFAVTLWQIWTDGYLAKYFNQSETEPVPINRGPYRYVRHPRYAAAIVGKVAMALIFASVFGWVLAIAWGLLLVKKIAVEEKHLRAMFGPSYESYARTTAKVIPGVY
jgi:protein-S-isoprenylcysteine O-methyltransferase Ste14